MTIRPIYLLSVTPSDDPDITHLPILETAWLRPEVDLSRIDGIIFTSKNGVDALEKIAPEWKSVPVLCVGKGTQQRVEALGGTVAGTVKGYGEMLYALIRERFPRFRWLYARPRVVASDFASRLRDEGVAVEEAVVYETLCRADKIDIAIPDDSILIFTSPSALQCFQRRFVLAQTQTVVAIGSTTEKSLPGQKVHIAPEPTVAACITLAKELAKEQV
ncbi:uroporphyrinogen-III synthase [Sulfurimonas sp. HSL-3221]|uniref:uroporphyrinogen-III synthase n=1 Tax=Sulfurimonadaceae TaxID=2771471 RepID=UPI001E5560F9|nr:uroporphyrinogen-III synthase [Sulfurimonas sp. HSL-3221]UFS62792.1 uroporphyrinogen-III synthase [Sulfurimonas sp. HSL-3221]